MKRGEVFGGRHLDLHKASAEPLDLRSRQHHSPATVLRDGDAGASRYAATPSDRTASANRTTPSSICGTVTPE